MYITVKKINIEPYTLNTFPQTSKISENVSSDIKDASNDRNLNNIETTKNFKTGSITIINIIIIPIKPAIFFNKTEVWTIEFKVSDKQLPTKGTKFDTASFAVLINIPSDADDANPENVITDVKNISIMPIINLHTLIIILDIFLISFECDTPEEIASIAATYKQGIIILSTAIDEIFEKIIYTERIINDELL